MERTRYFFAAHNIMIMHCETNNINQNQPKDILNEIMETVKTFNKKNSKVNTVIAGMLPRYKADSFRETPIYDSNKILNA